MKITFLGTGTSTGIPEVGCTCNVCMSKDARDNRLRTSALVETGGKNILLDCGPDFRSQMLSNPVSGLDAVIISHEHYDHTGGLDDLRPFCNGKALDIYAESNVANAIITRMPYAFRANNYPGLPNLALHHIHDEPFRAAGITVTPVRVMHACKKIIGCRIGRMAYLTDVKTIPPEEFHKLNGLDVLIISALKKKEHPSHESLEEALVNISLIRPKDAYLIHMSHRMGLHADVEKELPPHVHMAYDGLQLHIPETNQY
ncbi:MAG: MBL fold metallo-hydrolase [Tannerellaceae bacterium]|jgi:phosphoribosyl 1,2-cyclic phosphate phosphodiesterase|nr:MBL fold metallo-hydrolase [Tannerellaceae bacterium]